MGSISVDFASLMRLSKDLQGLANRTDGARRTAIGASNGHRSDVDDPVLAAQLDWFYRRWVQQIELLGELVIGLAISVMRATDRYEWADVEASPSAESTPPGRMRRPA